MKFEINSVYDLGVLEGRREGRREGKQEVVRNMLEQCIVLRFPQIARSTLNALTSITDDELLKLVFKVACTADSLDNFQRDIRGITPTNRSQKPLL